MSNPTIELGGGKWATKPTSLLAYNNHPEWGYNAKEFTVDRNSTATCVGSDGLIKTVQANEARIDYSNDPNGALLVEPQRTNLLSYSSDLTNWDRSNVTVYNTTEVGLDGVSPLYRFDENSTNSYHAIKTAWYGVVDKTYTFSFYAKSIGRTHIRVRHASAGWDNAIKVDLANGVILGATEGSTGNEGFHVKDYKIEPVGDFYRIQYTVTASNTTTVSTFIFLDNDTVSTSASGNPTYVGDGTQGIAVWGAQIEEASTASSYIPTNGTTVTRLQDYISLDVSDITANDFTAVIEFENIDESTLGTVSAKDAIMGRYNESYLALFGKDSRPYISENPYFFGGVGATGLTKVAFRNTNDKDYEAFINGALLGTKITGTLDKPTTIIFDRRTATYIRSFKLYPTALTDQELIDLTTI